MPPVHPAIVHFPVALVALSVVADLFGYLRDSASLRAAGWWALLGAGIDAALAVVTGLFTGSATQRALSARTIRFFCPNS